MTKTTKKTTKKTNGVQIETLQLEKIKVNENNLFVSMLNQYTNEDGESNTYKKNRIFKFRENANPESITQILSLIADDGREAAIQLRKWSKEDRADYCLDEIHATKVAGA